MRKIPKNTKNLEVAGATSELGAPVAKSLLKDQLKNKYKWRTFRFLLRYATPPQIRGLLVSYEFLRLGSMVSSLNKFNTLPSEMWDVTNGDIQLQLPLRLNSIAANLGDDVLSLHNNDNTWKRAVAVYGINQEIQQSGQFYPIWAVKMQTMPGHSQMVPQDISLGTPMAAMLTSLNFQDFPETWAEFKKAMASTPFSDAYSLAKSAIQVQGDHSIGITFLMTAAAWPLFNNLSKVYMDCLLAESMPAIHQDGYKKNYFKTVRIEALNAIIELSNSIVEIDSVYNVLDAPAVPYWWIEAAILSQETSFSTPARADRIPVNLNYATWAQEMAFADQVHKNIVLMNESKLALVKTELVKKYNSDLKTSGINKSKDEVTDDISHYIYGQQRCR